MNLVTTFLGREIKSPIVFGASNLSYSLQKLKELEAEGVGAVVFKTLFEEQVLNEAAELDDMLSLYDNRTAEMTNLFPKIEHAGPAEHLMHLKNTVKELNIPVVASLNCIYDVTWVDYAKELAGTGVHGLELNFYDTPKKMERTASEIEDYQVDIVKKVKEATGLPLQIKISRYYTNVLNFAKRLSDAGADSIHLFNRLFLPDIDIDSESFVKNWGFTTLQDKIYSYRFAGLLHGRIEAEISAGAGMYTAKDIIGAILSGADHVNLVSAVYKHGAKHVSKLLKDITDFMASKHYKHISEFQGNMSYTTLSDKTEYTRAQYVDILLNKKPDFSLK